MILKRNEFREALVSTVVPSNMPFEQQNTCFVAVQQSANKLLPGEGLYRFRRCDERSIEAFDQDQLWVSTADSMNDGYDSRLYYNAGEVDEWRKQFISSEMDQKTFLKNTILTPDMPIQFKQVKQMLESLPKDQFENIFRQIKQYLTNETVVTEEILPSIAQMTVKFCCFSESIRSAYMWGVYAADETGFALQYDFAQLPYVSSPNQGNTRNSFIFPMIYSDERFQVPTDYIIFLFKYRITNMALMNSGMSRFNPDFSQRLLFSIPCPDISIPTKLSLHKSVEWEKETEWRLFCTSIDDISFNSSNHGCCIKKPIGIYLGRRISRIYEKILRSIANEKGLPVYKMGLDDRSPAYKLTVNQIES